MLEDRYGNALTTSSPAARDAYITGVDRLLSGDAGIIAAFEEAVAADEGFALAHVALARTLQVQGRGSEITAPFERGLALAEGTTAREQSHVAIFQQVLTGRGGAAIPAILDHLKTWPRDAMVLAPITGVFGLIGFSGKAGREAEQLAVLEPFSSAYGDDWWFRMVLAFAEIELHKFDRGLRNIEASLRGFGRNAHAAHIRAHLFYELGERQAGLAYLDDCCPRACLDDPARRRTRHPRRAPPAFRIMNERRRDKQTLSVASNSISIYEGSPFGRGHRSIRRRKAATGRTLPFARVRAGLPTNDRGGS